MAIFTGIASAIGGAISAVSGFIGSLGAIGTFALKAAVGIGLNLLAQSISGKPQQQNFAINGTLAGGGDLPRSFIFGKYATAGSLVYAGTWGKSGEVSNAYLTQVIALSDLPVNGLLRFFVNGELVTIDYANTTYEMGFPIPAYAKGSNNNLWIKFYDGTQTVADPFLVSKFAGNDKHPYSNRRIGKGVAYAIVTAQVNGNQFSGIPTFKFEVGGLKLYDISKDSTVGGVGTHRASTPSTWGGDGDHLPAVQLYNILRGLTYNTKWFYGLQNLAAARLPAAHWIAQINKCRATISGASGLEPTYRSAGEIQIAAPLSQALEAFLSACQGRISEIGGVYYLYVGAPDAPVIAFTDGDILSTEEQSFTPDVGLADTINGISATYPAPEDGWNTKTAPPLYMPDLEAKDGNRRLMADVPLDFVPYAEQVQRLMRSALEEARRFRRHTIVLPPKFWAYATPGSTFSWTSVRNGYVNKLMRLDGVVDRANLDVMVDITEVDPADYDWNSGTDFQPPVDGSLGIVRPVPQPIVDWFAEPTTVKDNSGNDRRPAIRISWNKDQPDVAGVEFEVRLASSLVTIHGGRSDQVDKGSLLVSQGLLPNTLYGIRGRYIPRSEREVLWSDWLPVTTPNVLLGRFDVYYDIDIADLPQQVQQWQELTAEAQRYIKDELERIGNLTSNQAAANYLDKQQLRREISATALGLTASYTEVITVAVTSLNGSLSAVSQRVETLEAKVPGLATVTALDALTATVTTQGGQITSQGSAITSIQNELPNKASASSVTLLDNKVTAQGTDITANANAITALNTTVNGISANTTFRMQTVAAPSGWTARIEMQARVGTAGTFRSAGFLIDVTATQARLALIADQIVMTDGTNLKRPFVYQGNVLYLDDVRVNAASIVNLTVEWAQIQNVNITSAVIGDLTVQTSNLGFSSVTDQRTVNGSISGQSGTGNPSYTLDTQTVVNPNPNPVLIDWSGSVTALTDAGTNAWGIVWELLRGTTVLRTFTLSMGGGNAGVTKSGGGFYLDMNPVQGNNTYSIRVRRTGATISQTISASGIVKMLWWKR